MKVLTLTNRGVARPRAEGRRRFAPLLEGLWLPRLVALGVFLGGWEAAAEFLDWEFWISRPSLVFAEMVGLFQSEDFYIDTWVTLKEVAVGFVVGSVLGAVAGVALGSTPKLGAITEPFVHFANAIPRVALAPLFVVWFGFGLTSKVAVIVSIIFFVMLINAYAGVRDVDDDLVLAARLLGATRRQVIRNVVVPSLTVWLFAGLRLSVAYSFLGVVIGEFVGSSAGLGHYILRQSNFFNTAGVFAAIIIISALSLASVGALGILERRILKWQPPKETLG